VGRYMLEGFRMKYISFLIICCLFGCTSQTSKEYWTDRVFEEVRGKGYSNNSARCPHIKSKCVGGNYEEWPQKNGQTACACN